MMLFKTQIKDKKKSQFLRWNSSIASDLSLLSISGSETVSKTFCYELRSSTTLDKKKIESFHGKTVSCSIGDGLHNRPQRHLHGVVTNIQINNQTECVFRLEPALALLSLGRSTRVWQNMTVPELVNKLLGEHKITQVDHQLRNAYRKREYFIQYRESDLNFISRLLEEEGIYYFFKHMENHHIMVLIDHPAGHPPAKEGILSWHHQGQDLTSGSISRWSANSMLIPGKVAMSGYNMQKAIAVADNLNSVSKIQSIDHLNFTDITPISERAQLSDKVQNIIEALEGNTQLYDATVNIHWLSCGEVFKLIDHPTDNGYYRIQSLSFNASNNFESNIGNYQCEVQSLPNSVKWRPFCTIVPPEIKGVLIAKVVGPASEEIHTDEYGRIKIQFPWDIKNKNDDSSSCWVRFSQPWAGSKYGFQFIPRIGSEVLVSFIQGNPDFPLVIGSVYNGQNKPPFNLPSEKTESGFATRSTKKGRQEDGHRLSFNDKKGEEKLTIHSQKDLQLSVKNDLISEIKHELKSRIGANRNTEIIKGDDMLVLKNGSHNTILDKGNLAQKVTGNVTTSLSKGNYSLTVSGGSGHIKTDKTLVIESTKSIEIKVGNSSKIIISPDSITITSTMVKITGTGTAELKGSMTTVRGSGMTQIKGGIIDLG